jgi:hypothetical protein
MADTGDYPGTEVVAEGLTLINTLVADTDSLKFIERFNLLKNDLLAFSDRYNDVEHFYDHQRVIWEKLRKASALFQLNRLELDREPQASPALARIHEILASSSPYGLLKEVDGLIRTVSTVNSAMISDRRKQAIHKIDGHYGTLAHDVAAVNGDAPLRVACLKPLELIRERVQQEESLAHITQAETEAVREFDAGIARIEVFSTQHAEEPTPPNSGSPATPPHVVKKQRVIKPAELVNAIYLETPDEVRAFLDALRIELDKALANNERVQIR